MNQVEKSSVIQCVCLPRIPGRRLTFFGYWQVRIPSTDLALKHVGFHHAPPSNTMRNQLHSSPRGWQQVKCSKAPATLGISTSPAETRTAPHAADARRGAGCSSAPKRRPDDSADAVPPGTHGTWMGNSHGWFLTYGW